jgi:REP element-mobilizing transposase RayT
MKSEPKGYVITDQYATYFVTFTTVGWVDVFTRKELKEIIIESLKYCQKEKGLIIHAYVIMSNHLHLILRAKEGSAGLSAIIRDFKKYTSNPKNS